MTTTIHLPVASFNQDSWRLPYFLFCVLPLFGIANGQEKATEGPEYVRVTNERAQKIVSRLKLDAQDKAVRVQDKIAKFYRDLFAIHSRRNGDGQGAEKELASDAKSVAEAEQFRLHYAFVGQLEAELNSDEMDQVKNGLTYDVVPKTYQQYLSLYPSLTIEQQRTIRAWLLEAREHAMDAGSSDEKHAMFGKYKGRINNYLSAEGYDAKKAERELKDRKAKQ